MKFSLESQTDHFCPYSLSSERIFQCIFFFFFFNLFLATLGLRCCAQAFSSCGEWGLLFVVVRRTQSTQASVVAACGLSSCGTWALGHVGFSSCGVLAQ